MQADQAVWFAIGERLEQNTVDYREHGGVDSHA
jgi:hypothetical protein